MKTHSGSAWAKRMIAAGNCRSCGQPRNLWKQRCDVCHVKNRAYRRSQTGYQPWQPGAPGPKPKDYKEST